MENSRINEKGPSMNNINGVNGFSGPRAVAPAGAGKTPPATAAQAPPEREDQVEISPVAQFLSKAAALPEIRLEKVEQVRRALAEGRYDVEGKLSQALDQLLEEYAG